MDEIESARCMMVCSDYLLRRGIEVYIVHNLDEVDGLVGKSSKPYLTPLVSPDHNDLTSANSVWLAGIKDGDPVMLGGARLEVIGDEGIGLFWSRSLRRLYSGTGVSTTHSYNEEINRRVRGQVVYFGDMYVDRKAGAGLLGARAFTAIGHLVTALRWSQDWTYAFLHERDVLRGAGLRYGMNWFVPKPFTWDSPPPTRSELEWCALVSRKDQTRMIQATAACLQSNNEAK